MKKLIIAEKPALASAIKDAIASNFLKKNGYYENQEYYISWCIGHLLEVQLPDEDSKWSFDNLPLRHNGWKFNIKEDTKSQYNILKELLSSSIEIIHAGDPDEEGQLIVDSILYNEKIIDFNGNNTKPIKRLLVNDFNTTAIKKELNNLKDNNNYLHLSFLALARTLADKTFGYNLTRAFTLKNKQVGNNNVISIGRVLTPMLALIVRRESEIKNHVTSYYYTIEANVNIDGESLKFKYTPKEEEIDDTKKITSENTANDIVERVKANKENTKIINCSSQEVYENVPLPYNLLDLQVDCFKNYGYKADKVMMITQNLREKYKAITYNRSDCNYLLDETYNDAPHILETIKTVENENLQHLISKSDLSIKSHAFNSDKTSAHTGIIPTITSLDYKAMSSEELNIYLLIASRFVLQFFQPAKYLKNDVSLDINGDILTHTSKSLISLGFKEVYKKNDDGEDIFNFDYSKLKQNENIENIDIKLVKKETQPKKLYTTDTFLNDLKRVANYCKDDKIKKLLKEKDANKEGEFGGIGTPATRSSIIKNLYDKGYVVDNKKNILSTDLGKEVISMLPDVITYPDMTALWHENMKSIGNSMLEVDNFVAEVTNFSEKEIDKIKNNEITFKSNAIKCNYCSSGYLVKRKGKTSFFWGCSNYPECKVVYEDKEGKPDLSIKEKNEPSEKFRCLACNSKLVRRKSKFGYFWGCFNYPECKTKYKDKDGEPIYNKDLV